jgi:flavin-binding protein dodecin
MAQNRKTRQSRASGAAAVTGRDGAVDFVAKTEFLDDEHGGLGGHTYRVIELVGTSEHGIEEAIHGAIERAHKTIRNLRWLEIVRTSGHIEDGKVRHFQVTLKVGFTMENRA